ncbi:hypothetical protein YB2330_006087 [Saitoella coloradoensis]
MASYGYFTPHHPTYHHRRDTSSSLERLEAAEVERARRRESAVSAAEEREWVIFSGRPGLGGHRDSMQSLESGGTGSLMLLSSVSGSEEGSQAVTDSSGMSTGTGTGTGSGSGDGEAVEASAARGRRGPALQFPSVHEELTLTLSTASYSDADAQTVTTSSASAEDEVASLLADVMVTPTSDDERKEHGAPDAVVVVDVDADEAVDEGTASVRRVEAWMRTVDSVAPLSPCVSVEVPMASSSSTHRPTTSTLNAEEGIVRRVMRELLHLDDDVLEVFFGERVCSLSSTSSARAPPPSPAAVGFDAGSLAPDDSASAKEAEAVGSDSLDGVVAELVGGRAASMGFAGLEGEDYATAGAGAGAGEEMDLATSIWRAVQSYLHSLSHSSPHANTNTHAHSPTTPDRVRLHTRTLNSAAGLTSNWERRLSDLGRRAQSHYSPKPKRSWTCRSQSRSLITRTTGVGGILGVRWMGSWAEI